MTEIHRDEDEKTGGHLAETFNVTAVGLARAYLIEAGVPEATVARMSDRRALDAATEIMDKVDEKNNGR